MKFALQCSWLKNIVVYVSGKTATYFHLQFNTRSSCIQLEVIVVYSGSVWFILCIHHIFSMEKDKQHHYNRNRVSIARVFILALPHMAGSFLICEEMEKDVQRCENTPRLPDEYSTHSSLTLR